jgi:hypothetical protein
MATVTSLPFCKHTGGGGSTPAFSSWLVYLQIMWEVPHPCFPVEPSSWHCCKLSSSKVAGQGCHSCLLWPACLFTVLWGISSPPFFGTQGAPPSLLCVFFFLLLLFIQVFFSFFPGWGSVCPGGYIDVAQGCLWEYHVPLSSPGGLLLSSQ